MLLQWDLNNKDLHKKYVELCDNEFEIYFEAVVQNILAFKKVKILTVSGPSSSGKTTIALKLACDLREKGIEAKIMSMDNFYKNREDMPKKPDGQYDFETIGALDTELLIKCLNEAVKFNRTKLPKFNFKTGRREEYRDFELCENEMIIIEGIHALNPQITDNLPVENIKSIYTTIGEKVYMPPGDIIFSKRDIRILRRLIRDYKYRGASPQFTFMLWETVREAEGKYIFPYENNAHIKINSFYKYELNVIKEQALKLLPEIKSDSKYYNKARELTEKLSHVIAIDDALVPAGSLIREFIGGESLYY